jgi:hypothetical protein
MGSPNVRRNLRGLAETRGFKQNISQPSCIAALKIKRLTEYPSLMSAARVQWAQAIVLNLANIENSLVTIGQMYGHDSR